MKFRERTIEGKRAGCNNPVRRVWSRTFACILPEAGFSKLEKAAHAGKIPSRVWRPRANVNSEVVRQLVAELLDAQGVIRAAESRFFAKAAGA